MGQANPFEAEEIALRHFTLNRQTGEMLCLPIDLRMPTRSETALQYWFVQALELFLEHHGVEMRDQEWSRKERPAPLGNLLELSGNLATIDTTMPLSAVLTQAFEDELRQMTFADCVARTRATVEAITHNGVYVNTIVTLSPCEGSPPLPLQSGNKEGSYLDPVRLPNGTYQFALSKPFHDDQQQHTPYEADLAAWHLDAILTEYVDLRQ